ncbi:MAG: response regulator, partial [Gammaproteobacteria bacterium]|nr:response regulator [Gammaproteobacteria bacterium]
YILGIPEGHTSPAMGKVITEIETIRETNFVEALENIKNGKNAAFETKFTSMFGKNSHISANIISLKNKNEFCGGLMLIQDISSQVSARESILAAKQDAEEASQAKSIFLASVSHELRTPLHGILGTAALLQDTELNEEQKEYQKIISDTGQSLLETVNQILNLNRIEKGIGEIHSEPCNIRQHVPQHFAALINEIQQKGLEFHLHIDRELPERLIIGTFHLQHILQNLIHNACKFTDKGSISLTINSKQIDKQKHRVEFSVTDTGIGITPELQSKIFEAFTQLDQGTKRQYTGTGLGMTIARQMAEQLGTRINLTSESGKGSTFSFTLDLEECASTERPHKTVEPSHKLENTKKTHILVVDDNAVNRMIARKLLNKRGFDADEAESGLRAIELIENEHYDAVLMDIDMPQMDGIEATRKIRQLTHSHIPIIAMTAHTMQGDRERFIDAGMDDYIAKPFIHDELIEILRNYTS